MTGRDSYRETELCARARRLLLLLLLLLRAGHACVCTGNAGWTKNGGGVHISSGHNKKNSTRARCCCCYVWLSAVGASMRGRRGRWWSVGDEHGA